MNDTATIGPFEAQWKETSKGGARLTSGDLSLAIVFYHEGRKSWAIDYHITVGDKAKSHRYVNSREEGVKRAERTLNDRFNRLKLAAPVVSIPSVGQVTWSVEEDTDEHLLALRDAFEKAGVSRFAIRRYGGPTEMHLPPEGTDLIGKFAITEGLHDTFRVKNAINDAGYCPYAYLEDPQHPDYDDVEYVVWLCKTRTIVEDDLAAIEDESQSFPVPSYGWHEDEGEVDDVIGAWSATMLAGAGVELARVWRIENTYGFFGSVALPGHSDKFVAETQERIKRLAEDRVEAWFKELSQIDDG